MSEFHVLSDWGILARALSMSLQHGLDWQFIIQVVFPTPFPLFPPFIQCDWDLLPFSAWGLMAGLHGFAMVPALITVPSLHSSLFRPCSYYFAIPALINNARVYASITVPSPLSSLWPRSLLSSLCHPHSHHCAIPSCYFIDSTLLDHTDDTPFWTWFTKS